jgi:hypothetical protein
MHAKLYLVSRSRDGSVSLSSLMISLKIFPKTEAGRLLPGVIIGPVMVPLSALNGGQLSIVADNYAR